jgi:lipoyl(octanoyl) transferase
MRVTQCRDLGVNLSVPQAGQSLTQALLDAIYS